ncbi:MAG TPA: indole-3-glycerol phosphate synthase TrpC [Polyangiaceae bacterium]|nr:indole-3-glycerol phosphate synthase TrpC [Polyangiaceae bacterium]
MSGDGSGLLARILEQKRAELPALRAQRLPAAPGPRGFSLRRVETGLKLISEIKFRSPSAGALSTALSVSERARAYQRAGASMISVLCDASFFDGAYAHLAEARAASELPLLCKEFVIDESQLDAALAYGADAVLLIVRCLSEQRLNQLTLAARARKLEPFVEVVSEEESKMALGAGATLIGVNARDLDTLVMDSERTPRILAELPASVTRVHLSGIKRPADVQRVARSAADAVLIGEALMREAQPEACLRELVAAAAAA